MDKSSMGCWPDASSWQSADSLRVAVFAAVAVLLSA